MFYAIHRPILLSHSYSIGYFCYMSSTMCANICDLTKFYIKPEILHIVKIAPFHKHRVVYFPPLFFFFFFSMEYFFGDRRRFYTRFGIICFFSPEYLYISKTEIDFVACQPRMSCNCVHKTTAPTHIWLPLTQEKVEIFPMISIGAITLI